MRKPDSRFEFEKTYCPFQAVQSEPISSQENREIYWYCTGPKCELWTEARGMKGCSIRVNAESQNMTATTLLQILGQLKTRK